MCSAIDVRSRIWLKPWAFARPRSLPASYHAKTQQEPLYRIVCDYIAGMTDTYLIQQYEKYAAS